MRIPSEIYAENEDKNEIFTQNVRENTRTKIDSKNGNEELFFNNKFSIIILVPISSTSPRSRSAVSPAVQSPTPSFPPPKKLSHITAGEEAEPRRSSGASQH